MFALIYQTNIGATLSNTLTFLFPQPHVATLTSYHQPHTYKEVTQHSARVKAQVEIDALQANKTWIVTDLPLGRKAISSKWVYKIKLNSDGSSQM